jgi:hypothetical protein
MLTLVYAFLSFVIILFPMFLLYLVDQRHKRREREVLLRHLRQEAQAKQLSFTSQEVLRGVVFGLDGIKRQMLVVEKIGDNDFRSTLIHLDDVRKCITWQVYAATNDEKASVEKRGALPSRIILSLELTGRPAFSLVFYASHVNSPGDLLPLEKKAWHWEVILSKMAMPAQKRA